MSPAPGTSITINLLPQDPFLSTPIGKLMRWGTTAGRYLVIFTELIVIVCFASRFSLDRQITDLNTSLLQKRVNIESYGDLETNVRSTQQKIEQYLQVEPQTNLADVFAKLSSITPPDIRLEQLTIQPGSISLTGKADAKETLYAFIRNLQNSLIFTDVIMNPIDIESLSKKSEFTFHVQAKLGITGL